MSELPNINFGDTSVAFATRTEGELRQRRLIFSLFSRSWLVSTGIWITQLALKLHLPITFLIRKTIFRLFCGGESMIECRNTIRQLSASNVKTILDYGVEGQQSDEAFDQSLEEALRVVDYTRSIDDVPFCVIKPSALVPMDLLGRRQAGELLQRGEMAKLQRGITRIQKIAQKVFEEESRLMIDAEESWTQTEVDRTTLDLMLRYNQQRAVVYNTYQLYTTQALANMKRDYAKVVAAGCCFAAKLVRGAYLEKERERAMEYGYADPIHQSKAETDRDYDEALKFAVEHGDFAICAGTHNEASLNYLTRLMIKNRVANDDKRIYFAQLLGMSDNISFKLADLGYNVAKYVPYGPLNQVMPYLFRRAQENSSIMGQGSRELELIRKELERRKRSQR